MKINRSRTKDRNKNETNETIRKLFFAFVYFFCTNYVKSITQALKSTEHALIKTPPSTMKRTDGT